MAWRGRVAKQANRIGSSAGLWVYSYGRVRQVVQADWTDSSRTERSAQVVESQIAINNGDSGGPLVNDRAELVGVNHGGQLNSQLLTLSIATGEVRQFLAAKDDAPAAKAKDYFRLAAEHKVRKEWDKAKENLMQGLLLEPENTKAMAELAWVLNELKEYDNAIKLCGILLQVDQRNAGGWRELGYALLKKEKYEQSAKVLVLARVLNRKNP
jgi:tetratricopeptide (TPR) repeat protein